MASRRRAELCETMAIALALPHAEAVQPGGELAASFGEIGESDLAPRCGRLVGFRQ